MLKLEQLQKNSVVSGIDPNEPVRLVSTEPAGPDAVTAYYKTSEGKLRERMLFRADEPTLSIASVGRPWAFDAPGEDFKLAAEAFRINLAYLFDPMIAVHTSNVDPLPHQITDRIGTCIYVELGKVFMSSNRCRQIAFNSHKASSQWLGYK